MEEADALLEERLEFVHARIGPDPRRFLRGEERVKRGLRPSWLFPIARHRHHVDVRPEEIPGDPVEHPQRVTPQAALEERWIAVKVFENHIRAHVELAHAAPSIVARATDREKQDA